MESTTLEKGRTQERTEESNNSSKKVKNTFPWIPIRISFFKLSSIQLEIRASVESRLYRCTCIRSYFI